MVVVVVVPDTLLLLQSFTARMHLLMAASTFRLGRGHCPSVGPTWPGSARCATTRAVQTTDPYTHGTDVDLPRSAGSILSHHTVTCLLQVVWREQWHCEPLLISLVCGELPTV